MNWVRHKKQNPQDRDINRKIGQYPPPCSPKQKTRQTIQQDIHMENIFDQGMKEYFMSSEGKQTTQRINRQLEDLIQVLKEIQNRKYSNSIVKEYLLNCNIKLSIKVSQSSKESKKHMIENENCFLLQKYSKEQMNI
jgi:ribosomal protein L16/L10AE